MADPLTNQELQAIRDRVDSCVPGPWTHRGDGLMETADRQMLGVTCSGGPNCVAPGLLPREAHAEFLTAARQDIPRLLDEVARLRGEVDRLEMLQKPEPRRNEHVPPPKSSIPFGVK